MDETNQQPMQLKACEQSSVRQVLAEMEVLINQRDIYFREIEQRLGLPEKSIGPVYWLSLDLTQLIPKPEESNG